MHIQFNTCDSILDDLIRRYPSLIDVEPQIKEAFQIMKSSFLAGKKLLICGNGGSASDSLHIAGELMKSFIVQRKHNFDFINKVKEKYANDSEFLLEKLEPALPVIPLVENASLSTAVQNDTSSVLLFAQQVYGLGSYGDVLWCISTSGNSRNCVYAAEVAKVLGMKVVSLTGKANSKLSEISDVTIQVNAEETYMIQELHLPVYHALCLMLEHSFYVEGEHNGEI